MVKRQWILRTVLLVVVAGALSVWAYFAAVKRAWIPYNEYDIRSKGVLRVGDPAPEIELENADGSGPRSLSELYSEKPLVLVFGSYT